MLGALCTEAGQRDLGLRKIQSAQHSNLKRNMVKNDVCVCER